MAAMEHFGDIDIVVANAGVEIFDQPVLEVTEAEFDRLFAVHQGRVLHTSASG